MNCISFYVWILVMFLIVWNVVVIVVNNFVQILNFCNDFLADNIFLGNIFDYVKQLNWQVWKTWMSSGVIPSKDVVNVYE
jgi:hypothetical protein